MSLPRAAAPAQVPGAAALPSSPEPRQELLLPLAWLLSKSLWNGPCGESCVPAPSSAALGAVLLLSRQAGGTGAVLWTRWHQLALPQGAVRGFGCAAAATPLAVPGPSPPGELAEGLLQPHPLQPLLIKELIWTLLLWVSFVFRGATTGADSSSFISTYYITGFLQIVK